MENLDQLREMFRRQKNLNERIGMSSGTRTISRWALERKVG